MGHSGDQEQAKLEQNGLRISYFRKFLIKHACWGVLIFLLLSYRIPWSHTTPFMFEEYVKETRRPCRQVSHPWNVFFMICRSPETRDGTKSLTRQFREVTGALPYWYANGSAAGLWSGLYTKKKRHGYIPHTFPFSSHNEPPCQGSMWTSGSSEGVKGSCGLAQAPKLEWMSECQLFSTVKAIADPYLGG